MTIRNELWTLAALVCTWMARHARTLAYAADDLQAECLKRAKP
jgi:hypothetical protein